MKDNVILIGFMGAGKTSIGTRYAKASGRPLLDMDQLIEAEAGMSVSQIFAQLGEEAFRKTETGMLEKLLLETDGAVISTGGGLPMREENRRLLAELGTVVFLRVTGNTVLARLAGDRTRPLLQAEDKKERVETLLRQRNPVYEQAAHLIIDVDGKTPAQIVRELERRRWSER